MIAGMSPCSLNFKISIKDMRLVYRRALMQHRKKGVKPVEIVGALLLLGIMLDFALRQGLLHLFNLSLGKFSVFFEIQPF